MGKFCWNSTENVSLAKVPLLSMGGKLLQASKLHIWCINSLLNKCRPYITISGSLQPFKMVKIVPEKKVPQSARLSEGGGGRSLFGQCPNRPCNFLRGASLMAEDVSHTFSRASAILVRQMEIFYVSLLHPRGQLWAKNSRKSRPFDWWKWPSKYKMAKFDHKNGHNPKVTFGQKFALRILSQEYSSDLI